MLALYIKLLSITHEQEVLALHRLSAKNERDAVDLTLNIDKIALMPSDVQAHALMNVITGNEEQ